MPITRKIKGIPIQEVFFSCLVDQSGSFWTFGASIVVNARGGANNENGQLIEGANILIKENQQRAIKNDKGAFSLNKVDVVVVKDYGNTNQRLNVGNITAVKKADIAKRLVDCPSNYNTADIEGFDILKGVIMQQPS